MKCRKQRKSDPFAAEHNKCWHIRSAYTIDRSILRRRILLFFDYPLAALGPVFCGAATRLAGERRRSKIRQNELLKSGGKTHNACKPLIIFLRSDWEREKVNRGRWRLPGKAICRVHNSNRRSMIEIARQRNCAQRANGRLRRA